MTPTGKEFPWFENMNKLWQQQGKGEEIAVKELYHIIQTQWLDCIQQL